MFAVGGDCGPWLLGWEVVAARLSGLGGCTAAVAEISSVRRKIPNFVAICVFWQSSGVFKADNQRYFS